MVIRPPDPLVTTPTLAHAPYASAEATRRLLHLAYRDCATVLDLTYGAGRFWKGPLPPGITLMTNNLDTSRPTDFHMDFTRPEPFGRTFDLVVYDPPHVADAGKGGLYAARYGTATTTYALRMLIERGLSTAIGAANVGVLVKVTDHAHGGEWLPLSRWVTARAVEWGMGVYCTLQTYRRSPAVDPKWKVQRVPRSNGAVWIAFRYTVGVGKKYWGRHHRVGVPHRDFDREYIRQEKARG